MEKRISCRAVIFKDNQIVLMHRVKEDAIYDTFPGGGMEDDEDYNDTVIREVKEEFGIDVHPIRLAYEYHNNNSAQFFYLCEWTSGEFGTGNGPEIINPFPDKGKYIPTLYKINQLESLPLEPKLLKNQLISDLKEYGVLLSPLVIRIEE